MASIWNKVGDFLGFSDDLETQDKVVIAKANKDGSGESKPKKVTARARHAGMVYNYSRNSRFGQETYTQQEYDMSVIANAVDTDSFFRRAIEKYVELIWKSGFSFIGKNNKAVKYIRKRFEQMSTVTNTPTEELFRSVSYQIVGYANTYISKVRDYDASGGRYRYTFTGQRLAPVAGYFVEDTVSMQLAVKENGEPIGYKQWIPGTRKHKIWRPWNMIHMYYSRKPGLRIGTPMVWPVLDDIRALRKMEQNIELLVFQHTVPLFHYTVGTDEKPAQDEEIEAVRAEVERMPPNGCIVTPERHEIDVVGVEKKALDVSTYLDYFKTRVHAGLGMSSVSMGEGKTASKATAIVLDGHLYNTTETFQQVIKMFVNEYMIKELLAEGGYTYDAIDDDNKVELFFPPIDKEEQRAKENHYAQMYAQHAISEDELRSEFGRENVEDGQRENMYLEIVSKPLSIIMAPDESFTETTKSVAVTSGNTKTTTTTKLPKSGSPEVKAQNKGINKDQPANQQGRQAAKPKIAKNDEVYATITSVYNDTKNDVVDAYLEYIDGDEFSMRTVDKIKHSVFGLSKKQIANRVNTTEKIKHKEFFVDGVNKIFDDVFDRVSSVIDMQNKYDAVTKISAVFDSSKNRLSSLYATSTKENSNTPEE